MVTSLPAGQPGTWAGLPAGDRCGGGPTGALKPIPPPPSWPSTPKSSAR